MKVLLLDADGVVLEKGEIFSAKFAREYDVPLEEVTPFFKEKLSACQTGEKDLKEELVPYLAQWGWTKGVDAFLEYWFADITINPAIELVLARCKEQGITCYLASNNEPYRARAIEAKLGDRLEGYFFSSDLKVKKENPEFFGVVVDTLGIPASECGFVDNEGKNVEAARAAGLVGQLYREGLWQAWPVPPVVTDLKIS